MSEFVNNLGQPARAPMDEWRPALPPPRGAMEQWLALANFDARGCQRRALSDLTRTARDELDD